MAQGAESVIRDIDDGSRRVTGVIDDVAAALEEQSTASHDLASRVEKIVQAIEENSVAIASVAGASDDLNGLADELVKVAARFRIA